MRQALAFGTDREEKQSEDFGSQKFDRYADRDAAIETRYIYDRRALGYETSTLATISENRNTLACEFFGELSRMSDSRSLRERFLGWCECRFAHALTPAADGILWAHVLSMSSEKIRSSFRRSIQGSQMWASPAEEEHWTILVRQNRIHSGETCLAYAERIVRLASLEPREPGEEG
jgi:hypothetical protein